MYAVVARSKFRRQNVQNTTCSRHFWTLKPRFVWQAQGCSPPCQKWAKRFLAFPKTMAGVGHLKDLQRYISRGRRSTRVMFIRDVRKLGHWFPETGCILEHQIVRFAKMTLCDRCSSSCDLASIFRGRRSTLDRWSGRIAKRIGTRPSGLHSTFHFWRTFCRIASFLMLSTWKIEKSRRIAAFLMLSSSKAEEVLQNCCVFDVVNLKNWEVSQNSGVFDVVKFKSWGSLAELLRFWCCQVQKLRTSRRIASFSDLQIDRQIDKQKDKSINKYIDRQIDRQLQLQYTTLQLQVKLHYHYNYKFNYTSTTQLQELQLQPQLQIQLHYHYNYSLN